MKHVQRRVVRVAAAARAVIPAGCRTTAAILHRWNRRAWARASLLSGVVLGLALWAPAPAQAALVTFTGSAAFTAALPGAPSVLDFDALVGGNSTTFGTTIADGGTVGGITFNYSVLAGFGVTLEVRDDFDTTSAFNALGTDDGGVFQGGDALDLSFAPVNAIGMFFIFAPDPLFDDDITLSAGAGSVGLVVANLQQTLSDGGLVYFLGLSDDMAPFTSASVGGSGPSFDFTVDDITTAVAASPVPPIPLPAALPLFLSALAGLGLMGWRRRRQAGA